MHTAHTLWIGCGLLVVLLLATGLSIIGGLNAVKLRGADADRGRHPAPVRAPGAAEAQGPAATTMPHTLNRLLRDDAPPHGRQPAHRRRDGTHREPGDTTRRDPEAGE